MTIVKETEENVDGKIFIITEYDNEEIIVTEKSE